MTRLVGIPAPRASGNPGGPNACHVERGSVDLRPKSTSSPCQLNGAKGNGLRSSDAALVGSPLQSPFGLEGWTSGYTSDYPIVMALEER